MQKSFDNQCKSKAHIIGTFEHMHKVSKHAECYVRDLGEEGMPAKRKSCDSTEISRSDLNGRGGHAIRIRHSERKS